MSVPTSAMRRFPRSRPWYEIQGGIDVMNTLLKVPGNSAQRLDNFEYVQNSLKRRRALVHLLLSNGSELTTDYTSRGPFAFAHEYVDSGSVARLLHAHYDGTIQELSRTDGTDTARVTGLTANTPSRFATFMGACISTNGVELPQRADDTTWRVFGAPTAMTGFAVAATGTGITGTFQWIIVPIFQVGATTVVRGDWSNIVTGTLANQTGRLTWSAHSDTRVTGYEIYRSFASLGYPYYLVTTITGRTTVTYDDATTDAALSGQVADEGGRNGPAPRAKYVTSAGKRVVFGNITDATDLDANKTYWVSTIATNKYECEYFTNDKVSRGRLYGKGELTCIKGVGTRSDQEEGSDLFLAQLDSCYLLPGCNPLNALRIISPEVGVINNEACVSWGQWLFFVSLRGLEFLGPNGAPVLISDAVQALFGGGGEVPYNGNQGNQYITLSVSESNLYITTRQNASNSWGDTTLVMDLTVFQPYASNPKDTARFTIWYGPGMAFWMWTRDRNLLCFDNQNYRLLQAGAGAWDHIADTQTAISALLWTGVILSESPEYRKTPAYLDLLLLTDDMVGIKINGDYGAVSSGGTLLSIAPTFTPRSWDKVWDKQWYGDVSFGGSVAMPRTVNAYSFQIQLTVSNASATFTFIGLVLHYRQVLNRIFGKR